MADFEGRARVSIETLKQKHEGSSREFQGSLGIEVIPQPPLLQRKCKNWREKQIMFAKQKRYSEAQAIKVISDALEEEEYLSQNLNSKRRSIVKLKQQQDAEMHALLTKIKSLRLEHTKRRTLDSKKLLQRNKNIRAKQESKQVNIS